MQVLPRVHPSPITPPLFQHTLQVLGLSAGREKAATGPNIIGAAKLLRYEKVGNTTRPLRTVNTQV